MVSAPALRSKKILKSLVPIRTYVLSSVKPAKIQFSRHMLKFDGLESMLAGVDLLWGVQGTSAVNLADALAMRDAQTLQRRVFQVDLVYKLKTPLVFGMPITEELTMNSGYLHFSRLSSAYRKQLHDLVLGWLSNDQDPQIDALSKLDFDSLFKKRPMLVHRMMAQMRYINAVVHPVTLNGGVSLRIATVRNVAGSIASIGTRFYDDIVATAS